MNKFSKFAGYRINKEKSIVLLAMHYLKKKSIENPINNTYKNKIKHLEVN